MSLTPFEKYEKDMIKRSILMIVAVGTNSLVKLSEECDIAFEQFSPDREDEAMLLKTAKMTEASIKEQIINMAATLERSIGISA